MTIKNLYTQRNWFQAIKKVRSLTQTRIVCRPKTLTDIQTDIWTRLWVALKTKTLSQRTMKRKTYPTHSLKRKKKSLESSQVVQQVFQWSQFFETWSRLRVVNQATRRRTRALWRLYCVCSPLVLQVFFFFFFIGLCNAGAGVQTLELLLLFHI